MKNYALLLAVLAGVSTFGISQAIAAPACCAASNSQDSSAAAVSEQVAALAATPATPGNQAGEASALATSATQVQKLEVTTTYSPSVITLEKNKPVVLEVHRKDDKNCGGELLIPAFGIRAEIPAGETTEVKFTPTETGSFPFTCGMQMMKGELIVKDSSAK